MTATTALVASLIIAVLLVAAFSKPGKKAIGGVIYTDRQGRTVMVIWPAVGKKKGKRRK